MRHWYMLTIIGRDRPGIVAGITGILFQAGANLGEASMVRLGGNFTVMLMLEIAVERATLAAALEPFVQEMKLQLHLDEIEGRLHTHVEPNARVTVHGADRPGIVAQVTAALAAAGFNILDLESDVAGTVQRPIYIMTIDGYVAGGIAALEQALAPSRAGGVEVRLAALDTLMG
jgi:glycine cleavage system transcriptional repressor